MKKTLKIVSILMIAMMMIIVATPTSAAVNTSILNDINVTPPSDTGKAMEFVGKLMGFIQWGAIIGGSIVIAVLGVKYMMGSLEEKAEYKKSMVPLIIGIVVVMGATTIARLLFNAFTI